MSQGIRDIYNRDKFHKVEHIGQFVETQMNMPENQLEYQQRFRINNYLKDQFYGTSHWQYLTLISRLELIKKNDPDSVILLKVFPDNIEASLSKIILQNINESSDQTTEGETEDQTLFCLCFGAISICPGTTVRRHKYNTSRANTSLRLNCAMDACHLTGDQRGCLNDIVQPLGNNEILLDTFSVDAHNECRDTWNFALTCDKKALCRSNVFSFCGDRLKGQDIVNSYVYPELDFTKCHFHIKENIKEKGGTDCDISFFQEIAYSLSDGMRKERIDKYLRSHRPRHIKDYFRQSILPHQDKWAVYLMKGNKEGLFTCQMCESFHNTIRQKNIRDSPMVFVPELIIQYEHIKIHKLISKYEQQYVSHQILPSNLHNLIIAHTHNPSCYEIVPHQHAILCAKVTAKFNTMRFSHSINLSVKPSHMQFRLSPFIGCSM